MFKKRFIVFSFVMLAMYFGFAVLVVDADQPNFTIEPAIPDNQVEGTSGWFDLVLEPGEQQMILVRVTNFIDEEITVEAYIGTAITNLNGILEYRRNARRDSTLLHNMPDFIDVPEYVVVPALGSTIIELEITMPDDEFLGIMAGGITVSERIDQDEAPDASEGMGIIHRFNMTIAILLRNDVDTEIEPNLVLTGAWPDTLNHRNVIYAAVQNPQPRFLNQVTLEAQVWARGEEEVLFSEVTENGGVTFAPNTTMDFPIRLEGVSLQAGEYTMYVRATRPNDDEGLEDLEWELSYDFEITADEARRLNAADMMIEAEFPWLLVIIGVAILLSVLVAFIVMVISKKQKRLKEEIEELRKGSVKNIAL